jgi:hypothetical protein
MSNHHGTYPLTRRDICHTVGSPVAGTHNRAVTIALVVSRRQTITVQRLATAAIVAAESFAIFQLNLPFAGGDLADYNAHTKR